MTIVFTTIFGGSDSLKPAPAGADHCVCFVDRVADHLGSTGWDLVHYPLPTGADPRRTAWNLRCVPHRLFAKYDRVVWIDASFSLTDLPRALRDAGDAPIAALRHHERDSPYWEAKRLVKIGQSRKEDIEPQIAAYQAADFPGLHLSISCLIVRDRSKAVGRFNDTWRDQIATFPGDNTQVSIDYSAWVNGLEIAPLQGTRHVNPYAVHDTADHEQRRRPYL